MITEPPPKPSDLQAQLNVSPPTAREFSLQHSFTHRLHTLHKLTDRVSQEAYLTQTGLPMAEGRCLASIGAFRPLSVNDLAARANLNKAQASRAAQSLVDQGLVNKVASRKDARGVVLTLTPQGEQAWLKVMAVIETRNQQILSCLDAAQQATLAQLMEQLIAHAQRSVSADGDA